MLVKDVMDEAVEVISADTPLESAVQLLLNRQGGLLAVAKEGRLQGTLSEHDVILWEAEPGHNPRTALVSDVMSPDRVFLNEKQDVRDAIRIMREEHAGSLLVTRDQQAIGKVALSDLAIKISEDGHSDRLAQPTPTTSTATGQWPAQAYETGSAPSTSVFLRPIASPSILGFFGLAAAALVVGAHTAGWYGTTSTPMYILAFVALFGGVAQFTAGMWAYLARDGIGTAVHGTWGAFWAAYGVLYMMVANGTLTLGAVSQNYGFLFIPLCAITAVCTVAALADRWAEAAALFVFSIATGMAAIATLVGDANWTKVSGWVFMLGAICAWYAGSAVLLASSWQRIVLPFGRLAKAAREREPQFIESGLHPAG
jgi:uncharacterized protein